MSIKECETLFAENLPFWDKLEGNDKEAVCNTALYKKYKVNENIHGGKGECTGGIFVKSGCIRVYLLSEEGKEVTLYRLYAGDICMLAASCVIEAITFDVFVDAQEDTECYLINSNLFSDITKRNIHVENYALNLTATRFSDVIWAMQQIMFLSFDKRLAIFLYDEVIKTKEDKIHLTQEQIAKYMVSAREVVSRMLKYFAHEGIARAVRGGVEILDREKLRKLAIQ